MSERHSKKDLKGNQTRTVCGSCNTQQSSSRRYCQNESCHADFGAKRKTKKEEALDEARRVGRNHSKHQAYLVQLAKERACMAGGKGAVVIFCHFDGDKMSSIIENIQGPFREQIQSSLESLHHLYMGHRSAALPAPPAAPSSPSAAPPAPSASTTAPPAPSAPSAAPPTPSATAPPAPSATARPAPSAAPPAPPAPSATAPPAPSAPSAAPPAPSACATAPACVAGPPAATITSSAMECSVGIVQSHADVPPPPDTDEYTVGRPLFLNATDGGVIPLYPVTPKDDSDSNSNLTTLKSTTSKNATKQKRSTASADLDAVPIDDELYPVEKIIKKRKNKSKREYLVKWVNFDDSENTWEPEGSIAGTQAFIDFKGGRKK